MLPENRIPTHPGEVLQEEYLESLGLTPAALASHLGVSVQRIEDLIQGKQSITPETAWLLAQAFGTSPELWVTLQSNYDLATNRPERSVPRLKAG